MRALLVLILALAILAQIRAIGRRMRSRRPHRPWWVWRLRPRTPDDCPRCRLAAGPLERADTPAVSPVAPGTDPSWCAAAGIDRGLRQPACLYCGFIDSDVHALVADGGAAARTASNASAARHAAIP